MKPEQEEALAAVDAALEATRAALANLRKAIEDKEARVKAEDSPPRPIEHRPSKPEPSPFEHLRAAIVAAQKRADPKRVRAVVRQYGGHTGDGTPSLKAIPPEHYAACLAALEELPGSPLGWTKVVRMD